MPFYKPSLDRILLRYGEEAHERVCERLLKLRKAFLGDLRENGRKRRDLAIPPRVDGHLLLATWNIREFDSETYGWRSDEALLYLAEIISRFDLVAVQEVRRSVQALERLVNILGEGWQYVVTDLVQYRTGGNFERIAYLYDSRRVKFRGLAGELSLKPEKQPDGTYRRYAFARDPYIVGFRSEWFKFCLVTVHILWGKSRADYPPRIHEIEAVADAVKSRVTAKYAWSNQHILLGDFNIFKTDNETFRALVDRGFWVPPKLQELPSNIPQTRHYDQIAFMTESLEKLVAVDDIECGVFDAFSAVYRDEDVEEYRNSYAEYLNIGDDEFNVYKMWRTHQLSDHFPMWVRLRTDHAEEYLQDHRPTLRQSVVSGAEPGPFSPD